MKKLFKIKKSEKGQALVEFALILPILLLLVMGIIQFGIIFSAQMSVTNAVREGARTAAVSPNINDAETINNEVLMSINRSIGDNVFLSKVTASNITVKPDKIGDPGNDYNVTVTINDVFVTLIVPMPEVFVPGSKINLSQSATMRIEDMPG